MWHPPSLSLNLNFTDSAKMADRKVLKYHPVLTCSSVGLQVYTAAVGFSVGDRDQTQVSKLAFPTEPSSQPLYVALFTEVSNVAT